MARKKAHKKSSKPRRRRMGGLPSQAQDYIQLSLGNALGQIGGAFVDKALMGVADSLPAGTGKYAGAVGKGFIGYKIYQKAGTNKLMMGVSVGLGGNAISEVAKPMLHLAGIPNILGADDTLYISGFAGVQTPNVLGDDGETIGENQDSMGML